MGVVDCGVSGRKIWGRGWFEESIRGGRGRDLSILMPVVACLLCDMEREG